VHFLDRDDQMFDSVPDGTAQFEGRDVDAIYADYFRRVREMAATRLIDCLAHIDLIKIHGHRPAAEIGAIVNETLDFIRARNLAIELSTAGWRKPVNELYPGDRVIELAIGKGIPFTIASDAHSHAQLADNYPRLAQKLAVFGVRQICIFEKHRRIMRPVCADPPL
jgi:histidinol-phosphatase (PHP family)